MSNITPAVDFNNNNRHTAQDNKIKNLRIIACGTVIEEMRPFFPPDIQYSEVEPGLHLNSEKLKAALQKMINETPSGIEFTVLGFGLCSMAAVGLSSPQSTLVIPRVDDCIGMFLGSQAAYEKQLKDEHGTYFLSKGWIDTGVTLIDEFRQTEERLGKEVLDIVKEQMLRGYTRLAYIDMGHSEQDKYYEYAQWAADELGLRYDRIKGTEKLIKKLLFGPWDDDFIVAPPGYTVSLNDFKGNNQTKEIRKT